MKTGCYIGKPLELPGKLTSYWKRRESKQRKSFVHIHEVVYFNTRNKAYMSKNSNQQHSVRKTIATMSLISLIAVNCKQKTDNWGDRLVDTQRCLVSNELNSGHLPHYHSRWNNLSHFFVGFAKLLVLLNDTKYTQAFSHSFLCVR